MLRALYRNSILLLPLASLSILQPNIRAQMAPADSPGKPVKEECAKPADPSSEEAAPVANETTPSSPDQESARSKMAAEKQHKQQEAQGTADAQPAKQEKKGSWLFAPIPISSPAVGSGLEFAVARVFPLNKQDEVSPPSAVGVGGVFTNNGTRAFAVGGRLYFKEDKYRIATALGTANVNLDIYGVGKAAGDNGIYVPLNGNGKGFLFEGLYGLKKRFYVGFRGQYRNLRLSLDKEKFAEDSDISAQPPEQVAEVIDQIGQELLQQQTVSLGPRIEWDTRDSTYYPKKGLLMDVNMDFFSTGLGSKWSYQYYKFGFSKYHGIGDYQVLAFRGMGCAVAGDRVPIYDLCLFGAANDIRGYSVGRYQDRRMFAAQAEYRLMIPTKGFLGRFGVVAFAGFGGVGRKFSDIGWSDLLPGGGVGARFRLLKKQPINFRIDYARGDAGSTVTIGVLEAF